MEKVIVNAIGDACPLPVIKAKNALQQMNGAGVLEVHVDNEIAVQNVLRLASGSGHQAKSMKLEEKHFVIEMTVEQPAAAPAPAAQEPVACYPDQRGGTVIAIGSSCMGMGDDKLGATLMKAFIYAVSQQDTLPKTMLFFNGGAKLTVEGSLSLEDLKTMEAQGVEIMTCGTCLDFYGIKDKLAVGGVTNMYSIVETMTKAAKVIKP